MSKSIKAPQFDNKGRKFLFYWVGTPIYEGDENHRRMERCRKEFGGDAVKMAIHDEKEVKKFLNRR